MTSTSPVQVCGATKPFLFLVFLCLHFTSCALSQLTLMLQQICMVQQAAVFCGLFFLFICLHFIFSFSLSLWTNIIQFRLMWHDDCKYKHIQSDSSWSNCNLATVTVLALCAMLVLKKPETCGYLPIVMLCYKLQLRLRLLKCWPSSLSKAVLTVLHEYYPAFK